MERVPDARVERTVAAVLAALALAVGLWARCTHVDRKMFWNDETYTAIYVSAHDTAALYALFDGREHSLAEVRAFQHLTPGAPVLRTLSTLRADDPHHAPLFYLLDRIGAGVFGDSVAGLRWTAVLCSLLALVAAFRLGRVLFGDALGGAVLAALVSVGPFYLAYAHQAREYALLAALTFAATAAFAQGIGRAARLGVRFRDDAVPSASERAGRRSRAARDASAPWVAYAALVAAGFYTHPVFALVVLAHAVAAVALLRTRVRAYLPFVAALGFGIGAFLPFTVGVVASHAAIERDLAWGMSAYPLRFVLAKVAFNLGALGFDSEFAHFALVPVAAVVALLALGSVVALAWQRDARVRSVGLSLALVPAGVVASRDALLGSHFATIARYLTPTWAGVDIALAAAVVSALAAVSSRARAAGVVGFGAFVLAGCASAIIDAPAQNWWDNNDDVAFQAVAARINEEPRPLVWSQLDFPAVLTLSHYVRDDATFRLFRRGAVPSVCPDDRPTFLVVPTPDVFANIVAQGRGRFGVRNVSPDATTAIAGFHAALARARPGFRADAFERSTPFSLWRLDALRPHPGAVAAGSSPVPGRASPTSAHAGSDVTPGVGLGRIPDSGGEGTHGPCPPRLAPPAR